MKEMSLMPDPTKMQDAGWFSTIITLVAEAVLVTVTIGIITAMWLPAYLTARTTGSHLHDSDHDGAFEGGRHSH